MKKIALILSLISTSAFAAPRHVYLTWAEEDTSRTMTVNLQSDKALTEAHVLFDTVSRNGDRMAYRSKSSARGHQVIVKAHARTKNRKVAPTKHPEKYIRDAAFVTLQGLQPDTEYFFVAGNEDIGFSKEFRFKTLPADDSRLRLISGGDMGVDENARLIVRRAAKFKPDVLFIGGDIAYANGFDAGVWDRWFDIIRDEMTLEGNLLVPMILAIGNHECITNYGGEVDGAAFYYGYFAQGGRSTFSKALGATARVISLDTDHTQRYDGAQTAWLESELQKYQDVENLLALYHVPFYPAHRGYDKNMKGIVHWAPLFEKYGLDYALENHDHTFTRTHPIVGNKVADRGPVYLGAGCFGRAPRPLGPTRRWYQAKAMAIKHFWMGTLERGSLSWKAIDIDGAFIDSYKQGLRPEISPK